MTDSNPVLVPAVGDQPQIVRLGTVAAQNIALALNLAETHVATIERAIGDEINAMSSHFTLALADVRDQYETEVARVKSSYSFVEEHKRAVSIYGLVVFAFGFITALCV